ncbi:unnamed protein product [Penicillium roqueforti FM164]|uniref:Genomic scaffold, ProqFM164S04 n=1 Tax=Penicillium roqueforti (strain FM164) TaxID=1365484 RepID=W6QHU6_PENRF|nr:unnamed protein product [Penicillium roqueforti FM164]
MQDIRPFPRASMSIVSTFLQSASPNVAGTVLAIGQDTEVSHVHLYGLIASDIAQYGSALAPSSPPCLTLWAKDVWFGWRSPPKIRVFYRTSLIIFSFC